MTQEETHKISFTKNLGDALFERVEVRLGNEPVSVYVKKDGNSYIDAAQLQIEESEASRIRRIEGYAKMQGVKIQPNGEYKPNV